MCIHLAEAVMDNYGGGLLMGTAMIEYHNPAVTKGEPELPNDGVKSGANNVYRFNHV